MNVTYMMLKDFVSPPEDIFTGKRMTRSWIFLTAAQVAYATRRYMDEGKDRGKRDPLVMCASLWIAVATRIHKAMGNPHMYVSMDVCNYCGSTEADALIHDRVCADCHAELDDDCLMCGDDDHSHNGYCAECHAEGYGTK